MAVIGNAPFQGLVSGGNIIDASIEGVDLSTSAIAARLGYTPVDPGAAVFTANPTISSGTAGAVPYLNGSKVVTSSSVFTFDGSTLAISAANTGGTNTVSINNTIANGYAALTLKNTGTSGKTYEIGVGGNGTAGNYQNNLYFRDTTGNTAFYINSAGAGVVGNLSVTGATTFGGDITTTLGKFYVVNTYGYYFGSSGNLTGFTGSNGTGTISVSTYGTTRATFDTNGVAVTGTLSATGDITLSAANPSITSSASNAVFSIAQSSGVSGRLELQGAESVRFITYGSAWTERGRFSADGTFRVKGAGTAGSTDAVKFSGTATANAMTLVGNGDLLLGTTSAAYESRFVSVAGATQAALAIDVATGTNTSINWHYAGTAKWSTQVLTTGEFRFYDFTAGEERLRINTTGNVGISVPNPTARIHAYSNTQAIVAKFDSNQSGGATIGVYGSGAINGYFGTSGHWLGTSATDIAIIAETSKAVTFFTGGSGTERVRIDTSGSVGIGTTSPSTYSAKLAVVSTAADTRISVIDDVANGRGGYLRSNYANAVILGTTSGVRDLVLSPDNTEVMRLTTNFRVGIGQPVPEEKLDVNGNVYIHTSTGNPYLRIKTDGAGNNPSIRLQAATNYWDIQSTFSSINDELMFIYNGANKMHLSPTTGAGLSISNGGSQLGRLSVDTDGHVQVVRGSSLNGGDYYFRFLKLFKLTSGAGGNSTEVKGTLSLSRVNEIGVSLAAEFYATQGYDSQIRVWHKRIAGPEGSYNFRFVTLVDAGNTYLCLEFISAPGWTSWQFQGSVIDNSGARGSFDVTSAENLTTKEVGPWTSVSDPSIPIQQDATYGPKLFGTNNYDYGIGINTTVANTHIFGAPQTSGNYGEAMRIKSNGYVGINQSDPTAPLHVNGTTSDSITAASSNFKLQASGGDGLAMGSYNSAPFGSWIQSGYLANGYNPPFNNGYPISLNPGGGSVIIASNSTYYNEKFSVLQTASDKKVAMFRSTSSVFSDTMVNIRGSRNTANGSWQFLQCSRDGIADVLYIHDSGNVVNVNNSYGALSDAKLKENIVDASPKLADLMQVKIRSYNLKIEPEHKQLGVVAQELETIFPAMIEETADRDIEGNVLETKTKSVKYSVFVPMLIKAMQEQQAMILQLQQEVAILKGGNP